MKIKRFTTSTISSSVLLVGVVITVFLVTLFPPAWHNFIYKGLFTIIYFSAVLNIDKYRKQILWFSIIAFVLTWVSEFIHQETWPPLSKIINIGFFLYIVGSLVSQVARAKTVTLKVILEAINGYLLIGIAFATLIAIIGQYDPLAFNFHEANLRCMHPSPPHSARIFTLRSLP